MVDGQIVLPFTHAIFLTAWSLPFQVGFTSVEWGSTLQGSFCAARDQIMLAGKAEHDFNVTT